MPHGQLVRPPTLREPSGRLATPAGRRLSPRLVKALQLLYALACVGIVALSLATIAGLP